VFLKSLTLRGFKSFASVTTLTFEPGITAVVGPNGSGKSNVVDALTWVLGEQGARTLRGGRMEDVIFAGAGRDGGGPGRSPLGRAEVVLTIDNADGALPIAYSEVSITRTMFRAGGSDYAINGSPCRLLDVQELLSDSGIGREMHVIVGQGRLDAVLAAGPEERRAFVEEAAGILKHRRRKERALRKLDAMAANLVRVADLTTELRRQLKPLGRQAETARRAHALAAELREVRGRLLAADVRAATGALERLTAERARAEGARRSAAASVTALHAERDRLETRAATVGETVAAAQQEWFAATGLLDGVRSTAAVARERAERHRRPDAAVAAAADPVALRAEADRLRRAEAAATADLAVRSGAVQTAREARAGAQGRLALVEARQRDSTRAHARHRERVAALDAELAAVRSRRAARLAEIGRLGEAMTEALDRAAATEHQFAAREHGVAGLDAGEGDLDSRHERAVQDHRTARDTLDRLRDRARAIEGERTALLARRDALTLGLGARDAAAELVAAGAATATVAATIAVRPGWERAVAAALDRWADAVVVAGPEDARTALDALAGHDWGAAGMLLAGPDTSAADTPTADTADITAEAPTAEAATAVPTGRAAGVAGEPGVAVAALVTVRPGGATVGPALSRLLDDHVAVADLDEAAVVLAAARAAGRRVVAVTRAGQLLADDRAAGGGTGGSRVELAAAVQETTRAVQVLEHDAQRLRFEVAAAAEAAAAAEGVEAAALDRLHESDARLAAVAEELGALGQRARAARAEAGRLTLARDAAVRGLAVDDEDLAVREQRLAAARAAALDLPGTLFDGSGGLPLGIGAESAVGATGRAAGGDALAGADAGADADADAAAALEASRAVEWEASLAQRSAEERLAAVAGQADVLDRRVVAAEAAAARAHLADRRRLALADRAAAVARGADALAELVDDHARTAAARAAAVRADAAGTADAVRSVRSRLGVAETELAAAVEQVHAAELASAAARAELGGLAVLVAEQLSSTLEQLLGDFPEAPSDAPSEAPSELPTDRAALEALRRRGERALAELGRVNPLALEEFDAATERLAFLSEQLLDLQRSRDDLLGVVAEVDARVREVFAAAFADTAAEFTTVFARLFPGGQGRLYLTDPDDPLTSGVEVEARPAGKKVTRLSLLSGGERSLVAVALLVAVFKARPSPFYVLDEVEAALDDTNLGRLLALYEELRETSQLLIVTHQKRTMEIADALYGVSMRGDGVSTVISRRVRDREPVPAGPARTADPPDRVDEPAGRAPGRCPPGCRDGLGRSQA